MFICDNEEEVVDTVTAAIKYYFANNQKIAQRRSIGEEEELCYIHSDHLDSAIRMANASGNIVYSAAFMPFGEMAYVSFGEELEFEIVPDIPDNIDITTPLSDVTEEYKARETINISTSIEGTSDIHCEAGQKIRLLPGLRIKKGVSFKANINYELKITPASASTRHKFTGKELDSSGLYYYGARYYDPKLGRFIQPDPTLYGGLNRYTYCYNNPVKYTDPTGLIPQSLGGDRKTDLNNALNELEEDDDGDTITNVLNGNEGKLKLIDDWTDLPEKSDLPDEYKDSNGWVHDKRGNYFKYYGPLNGWYMHLSSKDANVAFGDVPDARHLVKLEDANLPTLPEDTIDEGQEVEKIVEKIEEGSIVIINVYTVFHGNEESGGAGTLVRKQSGKYYLKHYDSYQRTHHEYWFYKNNEQPYRITHNGTYPLLYNNNGTYSFFSSWYDYIDMLPAYDTVNAYSRLEELMEYFNSRSDMQRFNTMEPPHR